MTDITAFWALVSVILIAFFLGNLFGWWLRGLGRPRHYPVNPHREPLEHPGAPPEYQHVDWRRLMDERGIGHGGR